MRPVSRSILLCLGALCSLIMQPVAYAEDLASCVSEVTRVCAGMEDHLENCLVVRRDALSASCRQQLTSVIAMASDHSGPGACIDDVQRACAGAAGQDLQACILAKRSSFSPACRQVLQPGTASSRTP